MLQHKPVVDQIFGDNKAPIAEVLPKDFAEITKEVETFIANAAKLPKKLKDDTDLGVFGQHVTDLRAIAKRVEGLRTDEGAPLLAATKALNAFFGGLKDRLDAARSTLEAAATDYQRAKDAAERERKRREAEDLRQREEAERAKAETATGVAGARAEGRAEQLASQAERAERQANASTADTVRTKVGGVIASATTKWDFEITDYDAIDLNKLRPFLIRADVEKAVRSFVRIQKGSAVIPGVRVFEDVKATFRT